MESLLTDYLVATGVNAADTLAVQKSDATFFSRTNKPAGNTMLAKVVELLDPNEIRVDADVVTEKTREDTLT